MPGLDKNSGNGEASFLAVDAGLVRYSIDSSRVVAKAPVSGIGASACDQIVQYCLLQLGPDSVSKQNNVLYLRLWVEESIAGPASDAAA